MAKDLDELLARLAQDASAAPLAGLEDNVLRGIARRREEVRTTRALAPVRVASVGLALALGVAAGGMAAATTLSDAHRLNSFSAAARLAPSTLLEGAG